MTEFQKPVTAESEDGGQTETRRRALLIFLMLAYTLSFLDRQIVSILAEDIKADLALSDFELGMVTGLAFAVFYATLGIPLAWLADRSNRIRIVAGCLLVWSGFTAAGALAGNFMQLALVRLGVGIGEAGCLPASHSLIADSYEPA
ncbi:MAG: MFS transporter [Pseudomonadota bacterium]